MTELQVKQGKIIYFASAKDMPAGRFTQFQKYLFEDWGVGTTMADVDMRLSNAFQLVASDAKDKALQELKNLRMTYNYIIQKMSIKSYAFAVLVKELDGVPVDDYSESGLSKIVNVIEKEVPQSVIESIVEDVKKKLRHN
jgi:hypothetical protein